MHGYQILPWVVWVAIYSVDEVFPDQTHIVITTPGVSSDSLAAYSASTEKKSNRKHECCVNKFAWRSTVLSAIVCEREDIEPDLRLVKFPYCVVLPSISNTSNIENYWLLAQIWFSSNLIFKGRCGAVVTRHLSDMSSNPIKDPRCFLEQNVLHSLFTLRDIWQIYIYVK